MLFDPSSSTLYVDSHLANNLQLDDGTSVELPTDVLLNSINSGQVQVINSNSKMDVGESKAVQAQVIQPGWYKLWQYRLWNFQGKGQCTLLISPLNSGLTQRILSA